MRGARNGGTSSAERQPGAARPGLPDLGRTNLGPVTVEEAIAGKSQADLAAGLTTIPRLHPDFVPLDVANLILGRLGLSRDKVVSPRLVNAPLRKVERFLGLYFCADGWTDASGVHYASTSLDICRSLKRMLLRLGVVGNLHRREIPGHGTHWTVSIADKGMARRFLLAVGPHLTTSKRFKADRWAATWGDAASATNMRSRSAIRASER